MRQNATISPAFDGFNNHVHLKFDVSWPDMASVDASMNHNMLRRDDVSLHP